MKISSEKLKYYRRKTGKTSQEFADLCSIPVGTYFAYESGWRSPRSDRMHIIADKLGVAKEDIMESDTNYKMMQIDKGRLSSDNILKERVEIDTKLLKVKRQQYFESALEFAKYLGISVSAYYGYEKGKVKPTRLVIRKMCNALDLQFVRLAKTV